MKQLVQAHGGTIRAESDGVRKGSTFTVELPARSMLADVSNRQGADEARRIAAAPPPGAHPAPLKALVVDHEEDDRTLLADILSDYGVVVLCASCAEEAIEIFARFRPDVVVSDVGAPNADGFEFIERLRRLSPEQGGRTPAIALTAYGRGEELERATAAGFESHVTKPIDASSLVAAVARLVAGGTSLPLAPSDTVHPS